MILNMLHDKYNEYMSQTYHDPEVILMNGNLMHEYLDELRKSYKYTREESELKFRGIPIESVHDYPIKLKEDEFMFAMKDELKIYDFPVKKPLSPTLETFKTAILDRNQCLASTGQGRSKKYSAKIKTFADFLAEIG